MDGMMKLRLTRAAFAAALGVAAIALSASGDDDLVAPLDAINFEVFATNANVTLPKLVSTGIRDNGEMGNASNIEEPTEDYEQAYGTHFFSEDLDNASKVVLAEGEAGLPPLPPIGSQARPSYYTNSPQKAVLHVETGEGALYRSVKWVRKDDSAHWTFAPDNDVTEDGLPDLTYVTEIPDTGLYFDALVKFSVVPDGSVPNVQRFVTEIDPYTGDEYVTQKLLGQLLVYVNAFDTIGTPSNPDDYEPGWTNICVVGGRFDTQEDWCVSVFTSKVQNASFDVNAWHRLTIRMMSNKNDALALPVFEIFVDATNAVAGGNKPLTFSHPCIPPEELEEDGAYAALNENIRNQMKACEFITAVYGANLPMTEEGNAVLSGVGFRGEGYVDDYVVTTEKPAGLEAFGARYFLTLYWTPKSCMSSSMGGQDDLAYYVDDYKHDCDTDASQATFEVAKGQTVSFTAKAREFGYYAIVPPAITITDDVLAGDMTAVIEMGLSNFTVHVSAPEGVTLSAVRDGEALPGSVPGEGLGVVVPTEFEGTVTNEWSFSAANVSASPFIKPGEALPDPEGFTSEVVTNELDMSVSTVYRIASAKPTVNVSASFVEDAGEVLPAFTGLGGFMIWDWLRLTGVSLEDIEKNNVSADAQQASYMFGTDMLGEMPTFAFNHVDVDEYEGFAAFSISAQTNSTGTVSLYYESDLAQEKNELRGYLTILYKPLGSLDEQYKAAPWVLPVLQDDGSVIITSRVDAVVKAGIYKAVLTLFKLPEGSIQP